MTRIPSLYKYPWSFTAAKRLEFQASINTRDKHFFPPNFFFLYAHLSIFSSHVFFFPDFKSSVTTMALKKTVPTKRHRSSSTSRAAPPPQDDPLYFISREVERLYQESLYIRSFVPERGFQTLNAFFNFIIQTRGWQTLCAPLTPGVALLSASSTPTCHSGLASWCLSEVGGSTSGHEPSIGSFICGRMTVRSTKRFLWPPTSRA